MTDFLEHCEHVFVVRLWYELGGDCPPQWRASVEHYPSRQRMYFTTLQDLNDFITLRLPGAAENPQDLGET
jgi:hypothetical protein